MFAPLRHLARTALRLMPGLLLIGCSQGVQAPMAVPGSVVSLSPPPGFGPAPNFSGFVSEDGRASVLVAEMPAEASAALAPVFADEASARRSFAGQGVQVDRLDWLVMDGRMVPVVIGRQDAHGLTFDKWVAVFRGSPTVMITVQAPVDQGLTHAQAMQALASVTLRPAATLEQKVAALPFTVNAASPFRLLNTLAGSAVMFTVGELDTDPQGLQPQMTVAHMLSLPFDSDDVAEVSDELIASTVGIQGGTIVSRRSTHFAGVAGHRVDGLTPSGHRYRHYLALWPNERLVRLIAILPADSAQDVEHAVDAMAASVRLK